MEASPTCFWAPLVGMKQAFSDTRCNSIRCTPQQLLSQLLYRCLRAQKQTTLSQSVLFQNSLSQGLTVSQRSPVTPVSLTAFTGLFQARQDGGQNSVPNLRSLGSSPCYAAEAAWWYHGAKQARTVVPPKPRLNRENRHTWYHVSEAVPPQRPVVPPGVVSPVFPFVTPLCPPFAP